ncbi:MAG: CapA family protein [Chloroflexota bacterium]
MARIAIRHLLVCLVAVAVLAGPAAAIRTADESATATGLTVFAGGDIQFAGEPGRMAVKNGPDYTFSLLRPLLDRADLRLANLECNVSDLGSPLAEKRYTFRADPAVFAALQGDFDALSFANNHSFDYGVDAFLDTIDRAERAGLPLLGAGRGRPAALRPVMVEVRGQRVALLAFTSLFAVPARWGSLWVPTADKPGVGLADANVVLPAIRAAEQEADMVIVYMHWGIEYEGTIPDQVYLARAMIDAGADLVIGSHPHVAQTLAVYKNRLIAYSLGNFAMEPGRLAARDFLGLSARLATDGSLIEATVTALRYDAGRPRPATADEAGSLFERIVPGIRGATVSERETEIVLAPSPQ